MAGRAQVTSIEALEAFRAALVVYLSKARPTLEEVCDDVQRTRGWLQLDRRSHWDKELRRRNHELEQAQQELFSGKLSKLNKATAAQQIAVQRARRAVSEAEVKRDTVKKWNREFENRTAPLVKQVEQLHGFLATDLQRAVAFLAQAIQALEAYVGVALPGTGTGPGDSASTAATPEAVAQPGATSPGTDEVTPEGHP